MKKGTRRKAHKRANRVKLLRPQGVKAHKRKHENPLFMSKLDQAAMRKVANDVIGNFLVRVLDIDFVGLMEQAEKEKENQVSDSTQRIN